MRRPARHHHAHRRRRGAHRADPPRPAARDRLLLRLPDRQRAAGRERRPQDRGRAAGRRKAAGLALLADLPAVRAGVPAAHARRDPAPRDPARRCAARLPRCAKRVARVPTPSQPRPRRGPDRPLPGHLHAEGAGAARDRPQARCAPPARVGPAARRQRARAQGTRPGRRLPQHPCLPGRDPDRLRRRLLRLQRRALAGCPLRTRHDRLPGRRRQPGDQPGALHQPGRPRRRPGEAPDGVPHGALPGRARRS